MNSQVEASSTTEVDYTDCVAEQALDIIKVTCGVEMTVADDDGTITRNSLILAVISIVGDVDWAIFLGLPRGTAVALVEKFAGFEVSFDSEDMGDAVGELANILAGQVKAQLDRLGLKTDISLPSVMRAGNMTALTQKDDKTLRTFYTSPIGGMWTDIVSGIDGSFGG